MQERPFLLSGTIGIAVIAVGIIVTLIGPGHSDYLARGFSTPIIAFEFATESEDIQAIFFDENLLVRGELLIAMIRSTQLDFIFLVLYSAFLFSFSVICASLAGNRLYYYAAFLSVLAPLFDLLENIKILSIMEQLEHGDFVSELRYLHSFTWLKWGILTLIFLLLIPFMQTAGRFGRLLSIYAIIPLVLGIIAFQEPGIWNELFAQSIILMFLFMIILSFTYRESSG